MMDKTPEKLDIILMGIDFILQNKMTDDEVWKSEIIEMIQESLNPIQSQTPDEKAQDDLVGTNDGKGEVQA